MNEGLKRDSFVFYRSFKEAISELEDSDKLQVYEAIADYALNSIEPKFKGALKALFNVVKPQIDANTKRWINGKNGGAPKGNKNASKQPKTTKNNPKQPNVNDNVNVDVNDNVNVDVSFHRKEQKESFSESRKNTNIRFEIFTEKVKEEYPYLSKDMDILTKKEYNELIANHTDDELLEFIGEIDNCKSWHSYNRLYPAIKQYITYLSNSENNR